MNKLGLAILLLSSITASAQNFDYKTLQVSWQQKPVLHPVSPQFKSSAAVIVSDERVIEYRVEKEDIMVYNSTHKIIHINDDKGIETYNKVYIPVYRNAEISDIKARTILSNGKVIELAPGKIKEIEEEGRKYKLFAMEGLEKNAEVEYSYTVKTAFEVFGTEIFQGSITPSEKIKFVLITPGHLRFEAKGYNGVNVSKDSLMDERRVIVGYDENIKELDDEKYSQRDRYLKRVEYKLSYNLSAGPDVRLYTWKEFAKRVYTNYSTRTKREDKAVNNLFSKMNVPASGSEQDKVAFIEDYLKQNLNIDRDISSNSDDPIEEAISRKATNHAGIARLFFAVLEKAAINFQLVFPSDRSSFPLDNEFENWNRADDILFYFPSLKKFIDPVRVEYRYPYIPSSLAGTRGIFLKAVNLGEVKSAIASFGNIELEPFKDQAHNMDAVIRFNASLDTLYIQNRQIFKGYGAAPYRPIYNFTDKKQQDEATKEIIKSVAKSTDISDIKIENAALTDYTSNKPLIIGGTSLLKKPAPKCY